jgi:hypothetical protein
MKIEYSLTGKGDFNLAQAFQKSFNSAFIKSTEFLFAKCFENAPIAKTRKGPINLRNALTWDYDAKNMTAIIGIPKGSEAEKVAFYTEFGTGQRGNVTWKVYFNEKKPHYTIPIVPLKAKAMHFINESGKDIFLHNSMGQKSQAWMRRAFKDNRKAVGQIWKNEFKDIEENLKMKDVNSL